MCEELFDELGDTLTLNKCGLSSVKYISEKREKGKPKMTMFRLLMGIVRSGDFLWYIFIWSVSYFLFASITLLVEVMWEENTKILKEFAFSSEILFTNVSLVFSLLLENVSGEGKELRNRSKAPFAISIIYLFIGMFVYAIEIANRATNSKGVPYLPENQIFGDFTKINITFAVCAFLVVIISKIIELMPREDSI